MSEELSGAVIRLLERPEVPLSIAVCSVAHGAEIVYRVLGGEHGGSLRALASRDEHFTRIARVLKDIHTDCAKPFTVESLAKRACDERCGFPSQLQARNGQFPATVPQANPARPGEAAHGPRRLQRKHRREGGRLREPVAVQPGVQAALRHDACRGGQADTGLPRRWLTPRTRGIGAQ